MKWKEGSSKSSIFYRRRSAEIYRVFHGFGQAKSANGGSILGSSQFSELPQLLQKMELASIAVKSYHPESLI
jgi:hypothetical protein